jgi:flavin-dependent dehydrogenase
VEAVDYGWWYSAMVPDGRIVTAYMTDADLYAGGARHSANYWHKQLAKGVHTSSRLDGYALDSGPFVSAANSARMDCIAGRNWLAVGDAASALDPLSSQGVYAALQSGLHAGRSIERHLRGDRLALQKYASHVKKGFTEYLRIRKSFYKRELRWPNSAFWQRRQIH